MDKTESYKSAFNDGVEFERRVGMQALSDEIRLCLATLASIVRAQSGNQHADITETLATADRLLSGTVSAQSIAQIINEHQTPIDMVLFCPSCGAQHIDAPEERPRTFGCNHVSDTCRLCENIPYWTNPPHRSHLCLKCGFVWRPADIPTNGVHSIATKGKNDAPLIDGLKEVTATTFKQLIHYKLVVEALLAEDNGTPLTPQQTAVRDALDGISGTLAVNELHAILSKII